MKVIKLGSRASRLALIQANIVRDLMMEKYPEIECKIVTIMTSGDRKRDLPLYNQKNTGFFTKAIEQALLDNKIDIAVHSLKDLPTDIPIGLKLAGVIERENPLDVLISGNFQGIKSLPHGARIGTGSPRRKAMLLHIREDFKFIDIRGNVETRIKKIGSLKLDGIILAYAAIKRLDYDCLITEIIPPDVILPAAGQGVIALETRADDKCALDIAMGLNHSATECSVVAERSFLKAIGAGCSKPVGVLCRVSDNKIQCTAVAASHDGSVLIKDAIQGSAKDAAIIGNLLAERILKNGGDRIINE